MSPSRAPAMGAGRQMGRARNRSDIPFETSVFSADPGVHGDQQHGHHQRAGQDELKVAAGGSGQRAAEEVGEHQREHDRDGDHVEQLLGDVLDLEQGTPAEGGRRCPGTRRLRPRPGRGTGERRVCPCGGTSWDSGDLGHDVASFALSRPSPGWPVRARNTSSRLGWPRANSPTAMPQRASSVTAAAGARCPAVPRGLRGSWRSAPPGRSRRGRARRAAG